MNKIKVLLSDDHTVVRQGLRSLLAAEPDIEVIGEAENGRQAVQMAKTLAPDVVIMDIAMPQLNGLEATRQIIKEGIPTKVLVLSSYSDDEYVHQPTEAAAAGFLSQQHAGREAPAAGDEQVEHPRRRGPYPLCDFAGHHREHASTRRR